MHSDQPDAEHARPFLGGSYLHTYNIEPRKKAVSQMNHMPEPRVIFAAASQIEKFVTASQKIYSIDLDLNTLR